MDFKIGKGSILFRRITPKEMAVEDDLIFLAYKHCRN